MDRLYILLAEMSVRVIWLFPNWISCFPAAGVESSLYILATCPVLDMWFVNMFFHSVACLLILFTGPFREGREEWRKGHRLHLPGSRSLHRKVLFGKGGRRERRRSGIQIHNPTCVWRACVWASCHHESSLSDPNGPRCLR